MKTALQQLIEDLDRLKNSNNSINLSQIKMLVNDHYIKIEREQILSAFVSGYIEFGENTSTEYYNQTFKQ